MTKDEPLKSIPSENTPAAERAGQAIRRAISDGTYPPGTWIPAERVLAQTLGVGRPAVREAITALVREGIVVREPGSRPRVVGELSARAMGYRQGSAHRRTVAAIIPQPPSYVTAHAILRGINRTLFEHHPRFSLLVYDPYLGPQSADSGSTHPEAEAIRSAANAGTSGIVLWTSMDEESLTCIEELDRSGVPTVFLDHQPPTGDFDYVGVDNRSGVIAAVQHLYDLGHRRIAFLSHPDRYGTIVEREQGFLDGLHRHGLRVGPAMLFRGGKALTSRVHEALDQFMSQPRPPTAIIAVNDVHAFELLHAAGERGIRVPRDVSIVGFDDVEQCSMAPAVMTSVHQPFEELGRRAAEILLRRIDDVPHARRQPGRQVHAAAPARPSPRVHVIVATGFTVRSTTSSPPRSRKPARQATDVT